MNHSRLIRRLIDQSHGAGGAQEFLRCSLRELAHGVGFDNAIFFSPRIVDGRPFMFEMGDSGQAVVNTFVAEFPKFRALPERARELTLARGAATDDQALASLGTTREREPMVNEILRPLRISSVLDVALRFGPDLLGLLSLHRVNARRRFGQRQIEDVLTIAPTLGVILAALSRRSAWPGSAGNHSGATFGQRHAPGITRAEALLRERCTDAITLDQAARVAAMSPFHFARVFKASLGKTPHQFLLDCRLDHARSALEHDELSIKEIAHATGFGSSSRFVATFRKRVGLTPGSYRRIIRGG